MAERQGACARGHGCRKAVRTKSESCEPASWPVICSVRMGGVECDRTLSVSWDRGKCVTTDEESASVWMAWEPTNSERELELIVLGAMLGSQASTERIASVLGNFGMYKSDVNDLVECVKRASRGEKPLNENPCFKQWCERKGVELNGSIVDSLAKVVRNNGRRRASQHALTQGNYGFQMQIPDAIEKMNQRLEEISKT